MPSTSISKAFLDTVAGVRFADAAAIDGHFAAFGHGGYIDWFNKTQGGKGAWGRDHAGRNSAFRIVDTPASRQRFATFWNGTAGLFGAAGPDFFQFVCLTSIFVNEIRGDLLPIEELVGNRDHPGIAYAFDEISGLKRSYNTLPGNKTAFALFRDEAYRQAHRHRALADRFPDLASVGAAWKGTAWPAGFPTRTDPALTGFLLEADFFKFRGRGFIQTTGRANYLPLVRYVQAYAGADPDLLDYKARWAGRDADEVATTSSNGDWRKLFFCASLDLPRQAIAEHDKCSGNYLALNTGSAATLSGSGPGSIHRMGLRISGAQAYAAHFRERIVQICDGLGN